MTSTQTFMVTPSDEATNPASISGATDGTESQGARTYSVSGLDDTETYNVGLFAAADVSVDADGVVNFADDVTADAADQGSAAFIDRLNGATITGGNDIESISPVNGTISFRVNSFAAVSTIPAVWLDEEVTADQVLDLDNNVPTENFGIGGQKNWTAPEAAQNFTDVGTVTAADKDANTYAYGTAAASFTIFENALSVGDTVDVAGYNSTELGTRTSHDITEDVAGAPANFTGTVAE